MNRKGKHRTVTAGELIARLHSDPEWMARQQERDRRHDEKTMALRQAEIPLVVALNNALQGVGLGVVGSVWDLVNTSSHYPQAIPILLEHLEKPYPDEIAGGIGRALAVPEARPYRQQILNAYETADSATMPWRKDGLALAVAKTNDLTEVIRLLQDPAHGDSRLLLLLALRRSRNPRALETVEVLRHDPFFAKEIASWRRRG